RVPTSLVCRKHSYTPDFRTLSLHDALPISTRHALAGAAAMRYATASDGGDVGDPERGCGMVKGARRAARTTRKRAARAKVEPSTVRLDRDGAVATITLDRPEKLNALSPREHLALQEILGELRSDFDTRVVILTGAGRAFSAGADLANVDRQSVVSRKSVG